MAGTEPKVDRELLGRVAALTPGQQRWLRTVLQSIVTMESPPVGRREEAPPRRAEREQPRRRGLEEMLKGEAASEEEYPELAEELKGIADIADLLRESGSGRRKLGEELMKLFEASDPGSGFDEDEEQDDDGARFN